MDPEELHRFSKLEIGAFKFLYDLYVASKGVPESAALPRPIANLMRSGLQPLAAPGYIKTDAGDKWRITSAGVDEINFTMLRARRHKVLRRLYDLSAANPHKKVEVARLAQAAELDATVVHADVARMTNEGLIRNVAGGFGGVKYITITHDGIRRIEGTSAIGSGGIAMNVGGDFRINSDNNTTHGPNSPVQSRSEDSAQTVTAEDFAKLKALLPQIRADLGRLELGPEETAEAEAQLLSIEGQLKAKKPNVAFIGECVNAFLATVW